MTPTWLSKLLDEDRIGFVDRMIEEADIAWYVSADDLPPVERRFYPRGILPVHPADQMRTEPR